MPASMREDALLSFPSTVFQGLFSGASTGPQKINKLYE